MEKRLSPARKFKLITGQDVMRQSKLLDKKRNDEEANDITDMMESIQFGLYLAFNQPDLSKAKEEYKEFSETREFDTGEETLTSLMDKFKATFG